MFLLVLTLCMRASREISRDSFCKTDHGRRQGIKVSWAEPLRKALKARSVSAGTTVVNGEQKEPSLQNSNSLPNSASSGRCLFSKNHATSPARNTELKEKRLLSTNLLLLTKPPERSGSCCAGSPCEFMLSWSHSESGVESPDMGRGIIGVACILPAELLRLLFRRQGHKTCCGDWRPLGGQVGIPMFLVDKRLGACKALSHALRFSKILWLLGSKSKSPRPELRSTSADTCKTCIHLNETAAQASYSMNLLLAAAFPWRTGPKRKA